MKARVVVGLMLIGIAALWFLTPLPTVVLDFVGIYPPSSTRGLEAAPSWADWNMINTLLNATNAVFGAVGVVLTLKGSRAKTSA